MIDEKDKIEIKNENGLVQTFYKISLFKNKETKKRYIIYTDNEYTDGNLNIYSSIVVNDKESIKLEPIVDKADQEFVNNAIIMIKSKYTS